MHRSNDGFTTVTVLMLAVAAIAATTGCQNIRTFKAPLSGVHTFAAVDHRDNYVVLSTLRVGKEPTDADEPATGGKESDESMRARQMPSSERAIAPTVMYPRSIVEGWQYLSGGNPVGYSDVVDATADGTKMALYWKAHKQYVFFLEETHATDQVHVKIRPRPGLSTGTSDHADLTPGTFAEINQTPGKDEWSVGTPKPITGSGGPTDIQPPVKGILKKIYDDAVTNGLGSDWPLTKVDPR